MKARNPVLQRGEWRARCVRVLVAALLLSISPGVSGIAWASPLKSSSGDRLLGVLPLAMRLTGDLHGVFVPVPGRPLAWRLALSPAVSDVRTGELTVTGADLALRIVVELRVSTGELRWRIAEGFIDLAGWIPALATRPELSSVLAGVSATGRVTITGEGTWAQGIGTGGLRLEMTDGAARHEAQGWSVDGVTLRAGAEMAELIKGNVSFDLLVGTIGTSRFGARAFSVSGDLKDFARVTVNSTRVEIAGGEVTAEPFSVSLAAPALDTSLMMRRVGLQDLVVFVPTALSEARGRINGKLRLGWSPQDGVEVGTGELSLDGSESTTLRLVSTPGFLTEQVPARFTLLPPWLGPLSRWFSPTNPGYKTLSEIERGKLALRVDSLEVRLTPVGDERGRSASVVIRAAPQQAGTAVGEVTIEVNVAGPLAAVLRMGMKQNFSSQMR